MRNSLTLALDFYGPLQQSESAARRVGWESDALHELRLRALLNGVGPLGRFGRAIDVGCGEGRLITLLNEAGFKGSYRGEDVLPFMVERAKRTFPEKEFAVMDSFTSDAPDADLILCSGTLNTLTSDTTLETLQGTIETLWSRSRKTLALDFAVRGRHPSGAQLSCFDVTEVLTLARRLSRAPFCHIRTTRRAAT